jgi:hypothetical protein
MKNVQHTAVLPLEKPADTRPFTRPVTIQIDGYDDIFSDFDPRPFPERNISDDFLNEIKKVVRESDEAVNELRFLVPAAKRSESSEPLIARRLHAYFRKGMAACTGQRRVRVRRGAAFMLAGILLMSAAGFVSAQNSPHFLMHTMLAVCEPAGWFLTWTGLEHLAGNRRESPELEFFRKLSRSKVFFEGV